MSVSLVSDKLHESEGGISTAVHLQCKTAVSEKVSKGFSKIKRYRNTLCCQNRRSQKDMLRGRMNDVNDRMSSSKVSSRERERKTRKAMSLLTLFFFINNRCDNPCNIYLNFLLCLLAQLWLFPWDIQEITRRRFHQRLTGSPRKK
jgi:hypothetical protein